MKRKTKPPIKTGRPIKFPTHCASMKDFEARFCVPVEMQKYFRRLGCTAFAKNNSVDVLAFFQFAQPLLDKLFANEGARLKRIDDVEYLDPDDELARQRKENADDRAMDNAVKAKRLHDLTLVEKELWENGLSRVREAWLGYRASTAPTIRSLLQGQDPALAERVIDIAATGVEGPLAALNDSLKGKK